MKKIIALFCLFILLVPVNIFSFQNNFDFTNFTIKDGLTQNYIKFIYQDKKGFLWIGTNNGLNKYDGYKFTQYKFNPTDSTTISNNRITAIINIDDNNILAGTDFGFNIINSVTGKCKRKYLPANIKGQIPSNAVKMLFKDSKGIIYIGTFGGGLFTYDPVNDNYDSFLNDPDKKGDSSFDYILEMLEDNNGNLWIASYGGLSVFNSETKTFKNYKPHQNDRFSLTHKITTALAQKDNIELWVGTAEGLNIFNKETEIFTNYKNSNLPYLLKQNISGIRFKESKLWITTITKGIYIYDFENGKLTNLSTNSKVYQLPENTITSFCEDKSGILWFGTGDSGLLKYISHKKEFNSFRFSSNDNNDSKRNTLHAIYEDRENNIWLCTQLGLYKKTAGKGSFIPQFEEQFGNKNVTSIIEDSRNNFFIGTANGFYIYEPNSKKLKSYFTDNTGAANWSPNAVSVIYESSQNEIWVGTVYEGIIKYNYSTDDLYIYPCATQSDTSLLGYNVTSIAEDGENNLWIGTPRGLSKLNTANNKIVHFTHDPNQPNSLSTNAILSLTFDDKSNLWIGTYGGGLVKYDGKNFNVYLEKDGLPSSVITKVIFDKPGELWISTDNGISEFNTVKNEFTTYGFDDGLHTIEYNIDCGIKASNGDIYFGGSNGLTYFDPKKIVRNSLAPATVITSLKVLNQEKIKKYYEQNFLELNYDANLITIEFASLEFTNPSKNNYSYLLSGKNNQWVQLKERHYVDFANLKPGGYTFKVKSSNNDLVWDEKGDQINFIINPPFWNTWWFFLVTAVILLSIIYYAHHYVVSQKTRHLLELNKLRLEAADDFHDHIGHTLTRISLFTELLKKNLNGGSSKASEYIEKISASSSVLYNEAKDFIWSLDPQNDTVYELAVYLKDFGEDFFSRTGISFNNEEINENLKHYNMPMKIKREIIFVFKEIMNNALKYSNAENVFLTIYKKEDKINLEFKDDGIGFSSAGNGDGRGLKSIKSRIEKIGYELEIKSNAGSGTSFTIFTSTLKKVNTI